MRTMPWRWFGVVVLALGAPLRAAEHWVSTASALEDAIDAAQPGDSIILRNGVWSDVEIRFGGEGTAAQPITLRAETPGEVLLTGESSLLIGGQWLVVDGLVFTAGYVTETSHVIQFRISSREAEDCRVTNTAIMVYNPPDPALRYFWVSLYGRRNRVDHCYFSGQAHDGVTLVVWHDGTVNEHRIDHNHFAHHASGGGANGWETMRVGTSEFSLANSRTTVEHNLFEACDGEIEIISNKSCENVYRGNTFLRSRGMLTLRHGNRCLVEGNRFIGEHVDETGGIRVIGEDHVIINNLIQGTDCRDGAAITLYAGESSPALNEYVPAHRALVAFNTIVDVRGAHLDFGTGYGSRARWVLPEGVVVANNAWMKGTQSGAASLTGESTAGVVFSGNLIEGWAAPPGFTAATGLLDLEADGRWRPGRSSPLIDAAQGSYAQVTRDIDGSLRVGPKDVGADEIGGSDVAWPERTPANTGPIWLGSERQLPGGRLANLSTRGYVGGRDDPLILGFVVREGGRRVLVRAIGPTLGTFGVGDVLAAPRLQVVQEGAVVARNQGWDASVEEAATVAAVSAALGAFQLPAGSADSALVVWLEPGVYTAVIDGADGGTGLVLGEVYELR